MKQLRKRKPSWLYTDRSPASDYKIFKTGGVWVVDGPHHRYGDGEMHFRSPEELYEHLMIQSRAGRKIPQAVLDRVASERRP